MEGNQPRQARKRKPQSSLGWHVSRKKSKKNALPRRPTEIDAAAQRPTDTEELFVLPVATCLKLAPLPTKQKPINNQTDDAKFGDKMEADCARKVKLKTIKNQKDYEKFCDKMQADCDWKVKLAEEEVLKVTTKLKVTKEQYLENNARSEGLFERKEKVAAQLLGSQ